MHVGNESMAYCESKKSSSTLIMQQNFIVGKPIKLKMSYGGDNALYST